MQCLDLGKFCQDFNECIGIKKIKVFEESYRRDENKVSLSESHPKQISNHIKIKFEKSSTFPNIFIFS